MKLSQEELNRIKAIAEELRTTRYKTTGKMAFEYVYEKHKDFFADKGKYVGFLSAMKVEAVFWSSRGEQTGIDRENTVYKYV